MAVKPVLVAPSVEQLIAFCEKKFIKQFELSNFQRKYRKFFKFNIVCSQLFFLKSKISKHSIRITVSDGCRFLVTSSKNTNVYEFTIINDKEFIEKLIKHDLI